MKSDRTKYLVLGNSTAAIGAVEAIRALDRATPIVLVSKEPRHVYSRPLISYLLAGEIDEERMYYRPRDFYERNRVEARLGVEAVGVDARARVVRTADGAELAFEKLLVATGGRPFVPKIEGLSYTSWDDARVVRTEGVFTFTSWDDAAAIAAHLEEHHPARAVVVGGGLIGIKAAEALCARGLRVTIVELAERLLPLALDRRASELAARACADAGVELVCGATVKALRSQGGRVSGAQLADGRVLPCEIVVLAVGVVPDLRLVEGSGIRTERGIVIDDRCRTSVEGVFAAGDVAQGRDSLSGESRPIPIFPHAYRQGAVAGTNMAGGEARLESAFAMNSVEVFGLPTVSLGLAAAEGDGYEVLVRLDEQARAYKRIVLRDGRIVGALFVGDIDRAGIFAGLMRHGVDVSAARELLLADQFGLLTLPAEYRKHVVEGEGVEV